MDITAPQSSPVLTVLTLTATPQPDDERFDDNTRTLHWHHTESVLMRVRYREYPRGREPLRTLQSMFPNAKRIQLLEEQTGGPRPPSPPSPQTNPELGGT